jgi:Transmembrane domain of unknown function (DUF3566)
MSDRTSSSVRTGARGGDGAAPQEPEAGQPLPASATQSIPGASTPRAQAATGGVPAQPAGATAAPTAGGPASDATAIVGSLPADGQGAGASKAERKAERKAAEKARSKGRPAREGGRGPRRARLQLRHIDTWSALKISLVLSIALFFIWMVAVGVLYGVLNALGVFETLNDLFGQVGSVSGAEATGDVITPGVVFGGAAVIGAINIVLLTALCTVGTFIYNLCSDLVGGLEITLSERD